MEHGIQFAEANGIGTQELDHRTPSVKYDRNTSGYQKWNNYPLQSYT